MAPRVVAAAAAAPLVVPEALVVLEGLEVPEALAVGVAVGVVAWVGAVAAAWEDPHPWGALPPQGLPLEEELWAAVTLCWLLHNKQGE